MVNIAVLGYGTVGSGVVEVINTNHKSINKRAGAEINVKYVLDLRDFPGDPVEKVLVHDYEIIANDPEVDICSRSYGWNRAGIYLCKTCTRIRQERLHIKQSAGCEAWSGADGNRKRKEHQLLI